MSILLDRETGMSTDEVGPLQTAWLIKPSPEDPVLATEADYLDARLFMSPVIAAQRLYPAIDPLYSISRLLDLSISLPDTFAKLF
jgi:F0F1-type ATP synthase beta subunit